MKTDLLRDKFLSFFKSKKHKIIESDSLVPKDDPTVLFTPAGMNQFKKEFLGLITDFTRAASSQRCLRTDDLDKVGKTEYHHTFFEMLGNFSFGDYFKKEAISYAWEFLTEELKVKKEKLWVSVYKDDLEAYELWKDKINIPAARIVKLGDIENFWPSEAKQKGPNGPCGPCSEIFFDRGNNVGCKKTDCNPACSCGRFVEVWNLVFTQFNRKEGGRLEPLPKKNIDTGMGLERLAAVMQGVGSNFETDLFQPIIKEIKGWGVRSTNVQLIYPVADHIRAIVFAIYDGVLPSNEDRGYVIRKLIRKASMHLKAQGIAHPLLYKLVPVLAEVMHSYYPDLKSQQEHISEVILAEERSFFNILNSSDALFLKKKFGELSVKPDAKKAGRIAFELYDTYGLPLEITLEWLKNNNIACSQEEFNRQMLEQKERSKLQSKMKGDVFSVRNLHLNAKETKFLGYKDYQCKSKILKIIQNNKEIRQIKSGDVAEIILDKTVFYPESGGQIADTGEIRRGKNLFEVSDVDKHDKINFHYGKVVSGNFKISDAVEAKINIERRLAIARNHTATHMLQAALRKVLGVHVGQQGSLVAEDRLRFDFTHFKNINKGELDRIAENVNLNIMKDIPLRHKEMSLPQAKKSGALAFFGEKYSSRVRVVSIEGLSRELCGGTHLTSTGQIGLFKIIHEGSVASGVRRIEAVTGNVAYRIMKEEENIISDIAQVLNTSQENLLEQVQAKLARIKMLEKEKASSKIEEVKDSLDKIIASSSVINGVRVITYVMTDADMNLLRKTVDLIKKQTNNSIISLGAARQGKAILVIGITEDLLARGFDASKLILEAALILEGSGGGRKDFAQAGGNRPENFNQAFSRLTNEIERIK